MGVLNKLCLASSHQKDGTVKKQPAKNGGFQKRDPPLTFALHLVCGKLALPQLLIWSPKKCSKKPRTRLHPGLNGAAGQIRTGDLILTKDALYLLSYSSKGYAP